VGAGRSKRQKKGVKMSGREPEQKIEPGTIGGKYAKKKNGMEKKGKPGRG